jgi:hypothetical protein
VQPLFPDSCGARPKLCRLDFRAAFCFYRSVPAVDNGASLGAIGQSTRSDAVAFATTHWSVVLIAQGKSTEGLEALEKLCRGYWRPFYSFVRCTEPAQSLRSEEAKKAKTSKES